MDLITQGLVGASLAQSSAKKQHIGLATMIGFMAGLLADIDILIRSSNDPLLNLEFHRHFTHSVFFIPVGALIAASILWLFVRRKLSFASVYLFSFLGYGLSGFIDACTSYGTHLFWPVDDQAIAFNIISIVDPVFTLILLVCLVLALKKQSTRIIQVGLILVGLYLLLGWLQQQKAINISEQLAAQRNHQIERLLVKPTLGNLLLWRSLYQAEGHYYVDAIRVGLFANKRVYPGGSVAVLNTQSLSITSDSVLYKDIQRFMEFSDNYLAILPENPDFIVDMRYSMLPNSTQPLWGIEIDRHNVDRHAKYVVTRSNNKHTRRQFLDMVLGNDVSESP